MEDFQQYAVAVEATVAARLGPEVSGTGEPAAVQATADPCGLFQYQCLNPAPGGKMCRTKAGNTGANHNMTEVSFHGL